MLEESDFIGIVKNFQCVLFEKCYLIY